MATDDPDQSPFGRRPYDGSMIPIRDYIDVRIAATEALVGTEIGTVKIELAEMRTETSRDNTQITNAISGLRNELGDLKRAAARTIDRREFLRSMAKWFTSAVAATATFTGLIFLLSDHLH